jgi:hypothetical protein
VPGVRLISAEAPWPEQIHAHSSRSPRRPSLASPVGELVGDALGHLVAGDNCDAGLGAESVEIGATARASVGNCVTLFSQEGVAGDAGIDRESAAK